MARILNYSYFVNQFHELNKNFQTLVTFVIDKYGGDSELQGLLRSLGVKRTTIIPAVDLVTNVDSDVESEMNWQNSSLNKLQMKPCFVKLDKLDLETPDSNTKLPIVEASELDPRKDSTIEKAKTRPIIRGYKIGVKRRRAKTKTKQTRKIFTCKICKKSFQFMSQLKSHRRIHSGERVYTHSCKVCQKKFQYPSNLASHLRMHSKEKPFECEICNKSFSQKVHLLTHQRTHTGEKPYKCDFCSKSFYDSSSLTRHKRTHTGEKPFKCNYCSKSFSDSSVLSNHKRTHTGEKPFKCNYCSKSFSNSSGLARHTRTHTGEKPFDCIFCGKRFISMNQLKQHLPIHTGEKRFECKTCGKLYSAKINLVKHEQTMH